MIDRKNNSVLISTCGAALVVVAGALVLQWQRRGRTTTTCEKENGDKQSSDNSNNDPIMPQMTRKGEREIQKKQRLAEKYRLGTTHNASHPRKAKIESLTGFVPRGNFKTPRWIVTDMGVPTTEFSHDYAHDPDEWRLTLKYRNTVVTVTAQDLCQLDSYSVHNNPCHQSWHCVTGWSKHGLCFWGVSLPQVLTKFLPDAFEEDRNSTNTWTWLYQTSADGYTCPIAREDCMHPTALLILQQQPQKAGGSPVWLDETHGGPRIVVPHLWGWKSAKWMTHIELLSEYKAGFWENLVCHRQGRVYDPKTMIQLEERWKSVRLGLVANFLAGLANFYHHMFGAAVYAYVLQEGGRFVGKIKNALQL